MTMHIEILVEDVSGKKALDILVPKIVGDRATFRVIAYKGIGRIPRDMRDAPDPARRILLTNLPRLLKGLGRTFQGYGPGYRAAVIVICDLDNKSLRQFREELRGILASCKPRPDARFCLAIEEGEAWLLGDLSAILKAYPNAKRQVLESYKNDSICGTWEILADAVYPGGGKALSARGFQAVGLEKTRWAENIAPRMNPVQNASPSFGLFFAELRSLLDN